jgi:hypothetical protein
MFHHHLAGALLLALLPLASLKAQDVLDKIAIESCSCAAELDTTANEEQRNIQLGLCMLQKAAPYQKELKKKYDVDLNNLDEGGERFGQLIGMRLALHCPEFVALMARLSEESEVEEPPAQAPVLTSTLDGSLLSVKSGQFLTLVVKKEDGSTQDLLLLGHAENAEQVLRRPDQGRGTSGTWTYTTSDLYDAASRTYRPFYVLKAVEPRP